MVDEKFLDEMEAAEPPTFGASVRTEMIRLSRLGLWATKYGIPALHNHGETHPYSDQALSALPKDRHE